MSNNGLTEEMKRAAEDIVKKMRQMSVKYGKDWLDQLPSFKGSALLQEYHDKVFDIEKSASETENMTHLLYHLMNQHFISFSDMSNKLTQKSNDGEIVPSDLQTSFNLSQKESQKLVNDDSHGSYAWFSNMKLPDTFANSETVQSYYGNLLNIFANSTNVKVRRMHLFYDDLMTNSSFIKPLFTLLFVEKLMRIESKVVLVKNFRKCKDGFFHFDWNLKYNKLGDCWAFLLDFALFHNRGTDKSIYGNYTSLFSNFCFETVEPSTDINERTEQYNNQKTYCLTDYNIFHILKSYYLSFWNKDKYMKYLGELNKTNDNLRISGIIDFYDKNIVVIDFFEFWNRLTQYGIDYIFDENLFKKLYGWNVYKTKTKSADEISTLKGEVTPLIKNSLTTLKDNMDDNKDAFGNVIWNKESFKEIFEHEKTGLFKDYFLRDKIE